MSCEIKKEENLRVALDLIPFEKKNIWDKFKLIEMMKLSMSEKW